MGMINKTKTFVFGVCMNFFIIFSLLLTTLLGCSDNSPNQNQSFLLPTNSAKKDPKAFADIEFERIRSGLASINLGRMLIQRTHPSGSYKLSDPPTMILSADRHEILGKITIQWTGGITDAIYETDFTLEITKSRVRLTVERDTAIFQISPNHLRLAESDLMMLIQKLI